MTKNPQTEAENTPKLHVFGSHFRYYREKRGYSLKEAAGNTMSVASLSRFETDKQSITIEKLAELLMNIGVDIAAFMIDYNGQRIDKYVGLCLTNQFDNIPFYYQDYPDLFFKIEYVSQAAKNQYLLSSTYPKQLNPADFDQIFSRNSLNLLDQDVIIGSIANSQFPSSHIPQLLQTLKREWQECTSIENGVYPNNINNCIMFTKLCLQFLSRQGCHQEVFSLIDYTLKQMDKLPDGYVGLFMEPILTLQVYEVYSLIRSGEKTKAFKRRQELNQAFEALIATNIGVKKITNRLIETKSAFYSSCDQLLSGQLK